MIYIHCTYTLCDLEVILQTDIVTEQFVILFPGHTLNSLLYYFQVTQSICM